MLNRAFTTGGDPGLLDSLTTAVLVFDRELRLCAINQAGEDLLNVSARKVQGLLPRELLPAAPLFARRMERVSVSGEPTTERELSLFEGHEHGPTVDCTVTPLSEGEMRGMTLVELIQLDRHQRIGREEQFLTQHRAAEALLRGMAHEIKNPLGGLRGAAQLLQRELRDAGLREYTRIIIAEADRLGKLVDRLLGPKGPIERRECNIHVVLEHVRRLAEAELPGTIRLQRDYDPSLPPLQADRDHLVQLFLNLVRNAAQALESQHGGTITLRSRIERQVTLGSRRHRLVLRVEVCDNGPGVPEELQHAIFYPLITGRPEGTGLGLSIARRIVQQHGGLIECRSRPGDTVFTVWLPLETGP
ncbi:MAG: nitrogen regulation protein NR(II) [Gammaproteobacteria bacterium]|nr:MAG: nitrogen regulation protein NR(II) [Gammaproteobacteria bacterium]